MANDAKEYLESSFLSPLLERPDITDISYNGERLFYMSNIEGRKRYDLEINKSDISSFLRQIANLNEKQFSFQCPILDASFSKYRINATFASLTRVKNEKTYSFSLRIASEKHVLDNDFFGEGVKEILISILKEEQSIVIGGTTSSGKTELQKWLLLNMKEACRVIVIDNVEELGLISNPNIDLTTWIVNDNIPMASFSSLVKNSLRNNPDYVFIAEARGKEMLDAIISTMSGHPIIVSVHSLDLESLPERMARLAMLSEQKLEMDTLINDIRHHIKFYVYLKKEGSDGGIKRYIESIAKINDSGVYEYLYRRKQDEKI